MSTTSTPRRAWLLFLLPLLLALGTQAQAQPSVVGAYGNEWVQPGQPYYKVRVGQRGIHRLNYAWLRAAGLPVTTLDPRQLQLWRRGQEQAIYVKGETDGVLDSTEYVDFYGQLNDGILDAELFKDPAQQAHQLAPLYTDTASYFLTLVPAGTTPRRMQAADQASTGLTPVLHHMQANPQAYATNYFRGADYGGVYLPWADRAEGLFSNFFGTVATPKADLTIPGAALVDTTKGAPSLELQLAGSGFQLPVIEVSVLNSTGMSVVRTLATGITLPTLFGDTLIRVPLRWRDLTSAGMFKCRVLVTNAAPGTFPLTMVAYARLRYPGRNVMSGIPRLSLQLDSTLPAGPQYMLFDGPPTAPRAYDITDLGAIQRYEGAASGTQWGFVANSPGPGSPPRRLFIQGDAAPVAPGPGRRIVFRDLQPRTNGYFVVTHEKLLADTVTGRFPVRELASYRASLSGGQHDTVVVTATQLYDQFHYGDRSPNAIRRFARFMSSNFTQPGYLFLLGKGYQPLHIIDGGSAVNNRALFRVDFVPASGYPASDVLFTADFRNNQFAPRLLTGRLAAVKPADVANYLDKVIEHEAAPSAVWRKNLLHLGGGRDPNEQGLFSGYLRGFEHLAEDTVYLGGRVMSVLRGNTGQNVDTVIVSSQINRGVALVTFFGHSSTTVSDIDIGLASNPINNYNNRGKYPMMLMNGCASGNAFLSGTSFGQDWMNVPQRGAIGFLAHTGEGEPTMLNLFSSAFYRAAFNDSLTYGKEIARIHQRAIQRGSVGGSLNGNPFLQAQLTEMVLQADPAITLRSPTKPDFFVADSTITVRAMPGERVTARVNSFLLVGLVRNLGQATNDSVHVQVKRRVNGTLVSTQDTVMAPVYFADSVRFVIRNSQATSSVQGPNQFELTVDWANAVAELDETNNQAIFQINLPSGSVFPLYPPEYTLLPAGVNNSRTITLTGQYDQVLNQPRPYEFELDTVPTFRSGARQAAVITADRYPVWQPTLPTPPAGRPDSVVWYWRFKPQSLQPGEDTAWARSSFRFVPTTAGGWSQSHYGQFTSSGKTNLVQAAPSGKWAFQPALLTLQLRTTAGDTVYNRSTFDLTSNGIRLNGDTYFRNTCQTGTANIVFMVFDPKTLQPIDSLPFLSRNNQRLLQKHRCGQPQGFGLNKYYIFNSGRYDPTGGANPPNGLATPKANKPKIPVLDTANIRALTLMLDSIPEGYYVALVTMNRVPFDTLRQRYPELLNAIGSLGSLRVQALHDGDPLALVGRKGSAPGTAQEISYDLTRPLYRQQILLTTTLSSSVPEGRIVSTAAGPARRWRRLYHTVKRTTATASYQLTVVPLDAAGAEGPRMVVNVPSNAYFDLDSAGLDATRYPHLRLELDMADSIGRQAPQLRQWLVTYDAVPEGIVRPDLLLAAEHDLTPQTELGAVRWRIPFQNISFQSFSDSLLTEFSVTRAGSPVAGPYRVKVPALRAGDTTSIRVRVPVTRLPTGAYVLQGTVNPGPAQPELYLFNNSLGVPFRVENPDLAPLVDVAFDGQHILHGDIVAPSPTITVVVRDENREAALDPQLVKLFLTRPGQQAPEVVDMTSAQIHVLPVTDNRQLELTYQPGALPDGVYRLQVQAYDAVDGNAAGHDTYDSEFKVINETMISNFYPYPNPFSTSTRFLFTVTGKVPQHLKIQIMTVTGRVVREITREELGTDLRVGNNAGTMPWDGTDEYGDKLANGVYLYRVVVQDDGDKFDSFKTAGDAKAFRKNWGKLYILR